MKNELIRQIVARKIKALSMGWCECRCHTRPLCEGCPQTESQ